MEEDKIKEIEEKRIKGIRKEIVGDEFDGVSNANIEYAMEVYASYIREKALNDAIEVIKRIVDAEYFHAESDGWIACNLRTGEPIKDFHTPSYNRGLDEIEKQTLKELSNLKK